MIFKAKKYKCNEKMLNLVQEKKEKQNKIK